MAGRAVALQSASRCAVRSAHSALCLRQSLSFRGQSYDGLRLAPPAASHAPAVALKHRSMAQAVSVRAEAGSGADNAGGEPMPLLTPYQMGPFGLKLRMVYSPMTRNRATNTIPQPAAATYYGQRAREGLYMIAEGTVVSPDGFGYPHTPGIMKEEQVEAWKPIVKEVKDKGATFFCQLWHCGRAAHFDLFEDTSLPVLGPSPVKLSDDNMIFTPTFEVRRPVVPKEMSKEDIKRVVADFAQGARNALKAGFDGIELHGATGYLLDQFTKSGCNKRTDEYGGSPENRARFVLEVVDACVEAVGAERVGLRMSPFDDFLESFDSDPYATYLHLVEELNKRGILYVHMVAERVPRDSTAEKLGKSLEPFRKAWNGTFIVANGYTREAANEAVASGSADLVAFGRNYLANPDLPDRFRVNAPLTKYDRATFYINDQVKGYTDYPLMEESSVATTSA